MNVIVLPTYNEHENLRHALGRIREVADGHGVRLHTLVVDDNSPDGTGELADELAREVPDVSVLHRAGKEGLGKAYIAGFREALAMGAERVFEMDADLTHDATLPAPFPAPDRPGRRPRPRLALRQGRRGRELGALPRKVISRGGCLYAQAILGLAVPRPDRRLQVLPPPVLETIDLDTIDTKGYGFQIEMTYRVHKLGLPRRRAAHRLRRPQGRRVAR